MKRATVTLPWVKLTAIIALSAGYVSCQKSDDSSEADSHKNVDTTPQPTYQEWPIFRGDAELQGISQEDLAYPLDLAWSYEPPVEDGRRRLPIDATPVISDGTIYVGNQEGTIYALALDTGELRWQFQAEAGISGPAALHGDRVFLGDTGGVFYGLNAKDGSEAWRFEVEGKIEGGVNILESDDGKVRVFFGSHDYYLYCLDAGTGEMLWKHETDNYIMATPSIVNSGGQQAVTFGGCDGMFHIVPADGEGESRSIEVGSYIANSSSVRDGIAYVAHNGGEVLAVDIATGETVWQVQTGYEYTGSPAVGEKRLFVPCPEKKLTAYDRVTGEVVWEFSGRRAFDSSPVLTPSTIWQAGTDGYLYAIDPADGSELWTWQLGTKVQASPAISRGMMIICGQDGVVYAFREAE